MEQDFPVVSLLIITGLAAVVPLFSRRLKRLRIPIVVGEILAGMIVGRSGFNLIQESSTLDFLSTFGFTYLMFLSGLEVDFSTMAGRRKGGQKSLLSHPAIMGVAVFAATLVGGNLAAFGLERLGLVQTPLVMALILSTTSLGIVVPVLKERRLSNTDYGQALLLSALVADFATLLLVSVVVAAVSRGLTLDLLLVLLLLAVFAAFSHIGRQAAQFPRLRLAIDELAHATAQIKVRGAFALMVIFMVVAEGVGTEIILGAFLAGAAVSLLSDREGSHLHMKMDAIGFGFFIPIFFIMVGARFDLFSLFSSPKALLLVPVLVVVAYAIKFIASLLFKLRFSWRETLGAGALLSSRLSLIIAAAAISLELGVIDDATNAAVILVAIVTCTVSPILFNRFLPVEEEMVRKGVILAGLGEMSALLADRLRQSGDQVTLLGTGKHRIDDMRRRGHTVLAADPTDPEALEAAGASTAAALMAVTSEDEVNLEVCRVAQERFRIPNRIALVRDREVRDILVSNSTRVVQPQTAAVLALAGALQFPAAFDMLSDPADGVEVRETALRNPRMNGQQLRKIQLPGGVLLLGLRRDGDVLVPHGDTVLREGDVLMLLGHPEELKDAMTCIGFVESGTEAPPEEGDLVGCGLKLMKPGRCDNFG